MSFDHTDTQFSPFDQDNLLKDDFEQDFLSRDVREPIELQEDHLLGSLGGPITNESICISNSKNILRRFNFLPDPPSYKMQKTENTAKIVIQRDLKTKAVEETMTRQEMAEFCKRRKTKQDEKEKRATKTNSG
jgi:hypothetical protein